MGKILRKRTERLTARQNGFMANPPKRSASTTAGPRGPQDHGLNGNGKVAKFPGSMK